MSGFDKAFFDEGVRRTGTQSVKWDAMIAEHGDEAMIPMWVADMDFKSPPAIRKALEDVLARDTWGYTLSGVQDAQALSDYWQRRHQVAFEAQDVIMSPCVITGMRAALRAMTREGDGVLITTPVYGPFYASISVNGRRKVEVPLIRDEQGRYTLDFAQMEEKLASGEAKAVMFCSPHNPCGRAWTREELEKLADMCVRFGAPLIVDEIHADFVYAPGRHVSILDIDSVKETAVMLCAASKTYNIAGLQQSSIVCRNADTREAISREMDAAGVKAGNAFALAATRAAYTACDDWLDGLKAYLMENRDFVVAYVKANMPRIVVTPLEATYLMWLDCRALGIAQKDLMDRLHAAHVKVNDGTIFGHLGDGFIRLNIGCPKAQLEAALTCMKTVLA